MKKKIRIKRGVIALAITGIIALSGCSANTSATSDSEASSEDTEYKYGEVQIPALDGALCGAPIYIAYENGYFAEEGLDVKLISADAETRKIGLNDGTIPITNGDYMYFQSIEQDVDVTVVDGLHNGCIKILVPKGSDIDSAEDLIGAKIGVDEIGGTPYQVSSLWLENNGVKANGNDAQVTFLPYSDGNLQLEALYSGEIDAAAIWDPVGAKAIASGKAEALLDIGTDDIFADKYCCFIYASNKVLDENPEEIAALLRALHKASQYINDDPESSAKIISEGGYSEIDDIDMAVELLQSYQYPTLEEFESGERDVKEQVQFFAEQLYDIGYLSTPADELIDRLYTKVDY
ncbi:ABC transporter substrate-binding protein [Eubacterium oxidoreducens]|uniref:NitT/TauT family transport system substrate-binding protein n=1 Tax=Eubacterium oxidoreducens TaxID=1732 RepID=A0A1G6C248_EUBOX|nr:ABC transporter substrate-binding protein [Eubacterium oxidoreducens]SDB26951.1 NitT/TauT family transport system substrate-binding protein [Eubacterium oxidoreducens]